VHVVEGKEHRLTSLHKGTTSGGSAGPAATATVTANGPAGADGAAAGQQPPSLSAAALAAAQATREAGGGDAAAASAAAAATAAAAAAAAAATAAQASPEGEAAQQLPLITVTSYEMLKRLSCEPCRKGCALYERCSWMQPGRRSGSARCFLALLAA